MPHPPTPPARKRQYHAKPGSRATTPALDEVILYLTVRGLSAPLIARALGLTHRIVNLRATTAAAFLAKHAYRERLIANCANDLEAAGVNVDAALAVIREYNLRELNRA